jgi:hypothetical protein
MQLSRRQCYLILGLITLTLTISAFGKQSVANGEDFFAYWRAAERWLSGNSPYVAEQDYAFKYGPASVLYFVPFALLPYQIARWTWAVFHLGLALFLPVAAIRLTQKNFSLCDFTVALSVGWVGAFRFVDGEFQVSQAGLLICAWIILALYALGEKAEPSFRNRFLSGVCLAAGGVVKVHGLNSFSVLLKTKASHLKNLIPWALGACVILVLPNPQMWVDWVHQMNATTRLLPMAPGAFNFQGVYPFSVWFLGVEERSTLPLLYFFLPAWLATLVALPKNIDASRESLFFGVGSLLLLGVQSSPLPWQYTYSLLWVWIPPLWMTLQGRARNILLATALALGLSPKGILGAPLSNFFEGFQSIFVLSLVLNVLLIHAARLTGPSTLPDLSRDTKS